MADFQDATNYVNALMEIYDKELADGRELANLTINQFAVNSKDWRGKGWYEDIHVSGNRAGVISGTESEALATEYRQVYKQYIVPVRFIAGQIKLTEKVMLASKAGGAVFTDGEALGQEIRGMRDDIMSISEIDTWGYGKSVLGIVGATATSATVTTKAPDYTQNIFENDLIDSTAALGGGSFGIDGIRVKSVDPDNNQFTLASSATATADEFIVRAAHSETTMATNGQSIMGLQGIVDDGTLIATFQNIARTGSSKVRAAISNVLNNAGSNRTLSLVLLQQAVNEVIKRMGGTAEDDDVGKDFCLYCNFPQEVEFLRLMFPATIYMNTTDYKAGRTGISFNGIPIKKRKHAPREKWFGIHKNSIKHYELAPLGMLGGYTGENKALRWVDGYLQAKGVMRWWHYLGSPVPFRHFRLDDISE